MTSLVVLLGRQIAYSASPAMLDAAFRAAGIDARYELRDVDPPALAGAVDALRQPAALGANVTQPHKLTVVAFLDALAGDAERLGAVNTIVSAGRRLIGHNTDLAAVAAELEALGVGDRRRAVVLGAGGASRAVLAALEDAEVPQVEVVTRDRWSSLPAVLDGADLLVNATPIGTGGDELPVEPALLRPDLAVLDLVYRPSPTRLVRAAAERGATARDGSGMLLRQAAAAFELWTGEAAPVDAMRRALETELGVVTHD